MHGAIIINRDRCNLSAIHVLTNVQVANASNADGAAVKELAFEADLDLLPIVTRAEGVDPRHDREQQESLRTVIDRLAGGGQLRAVALNLSQQPEGVGLLTSDP